MALTKYYVVVSVAAALVASFYTIEAVSGSGAVFNWLTQWAHTCPLPQPTKEIVSGLLAWCNNVFLALHQPELYTVVDDSDQALPASAMRFGGVVSGQEDASTGSSVHGLGGLFGWTTGMEGIPKTLMLDAITSLVGYRESETMQLLVGYLQREKFISLLYINVFYCFLFLIGKGIIHVVFGSLRVIESQHMYDRLLNYILFKIVFIGAILETSWEELFMWVAWFSLLGFLRIFSMLSRDRFEYLSYSMNTSWSLHVSINILLASILFIDLGLFVFCITLFGKSGLSCLSLVTFECFTLFLDTAQTSVKYGIHLYDISYPGVWELRGSLVYLTEFFTDTLVLIATLLHYVHILLLQGISFTLIDAVLFLNIRSVFFNLRKKLVSFRNYRQAMNNMETRYPSATAADLAVFNDDCAICREKMDSGKILPCRHIFHLSCLRSWLEHHSSCPTCRRSLLTPETETTNEPQQRAWNRHELLSRVARRSSRANIRNASSSSAGTSTSDPSMPISMPSSTGSASASSASSSFSSPSTSSATFSLSEERPSVRGVSHDTEYAGTNRLPELETDPISGVRRTVSSGSATNSNAAMFLSSMASARNTLRRRLGLRETDPNEPYGQFDAASSGRPTVAGGDRRFSDMNPMSAQQSRLQHPHTGDRGDDRDRDHRAGQQYHRVVHIGPFHIGFDPSALWMNNSRWGNWLLSFTVELGRRQPESADEPRGSEVTRMLLMVQQVQEIFPHVPREIIERDLAITGSVEMTTINILEGRVTLDREHEQTWPASEPMTEPDPSCAAAASTAASLGSSHAPGVSVATKPSQISSSLSTASASSPPATSSSSSSNGTALNVSSRNVSSSHLAGPADSDEPGNLGDPLADAGQEEVSLGRLSLSSSSSSSSSSPAPSAETAGDSRSASASHSPSASQEGASWFSSNHNDVKKGPGSIAALTGALAPTANQGGQNDARAQEEEESLEARRARMLEATMRRIQPADLSFES